MRSVLAVGEDGASGRIVMMMMLLLLLLFFFFQAEDGIRDTSVTGVQTCALPISKHFDSCKKNIEADIAQKPDHEEKQHRFRDEIR